MGGIILCLSRGDQAEAYYARTRAACSVNMRGDSEPVLPLFLFLFLLTTCPRPGHVCMDVVRQEVDGPWLGRPET